MRNRKVKFVIDTNIFVRGQVLFKEFPKYIPFFDVIYDLIEENKIELVFSQDTIGELIYNMKNYVFHEKMAEEIKIEIMNTISRLFYYSYSVNTEDKIAPKCDDPKDDMFLVCAQEGRATYLISDDFKSGMHRIKGLKYKVMGSDEFMEMYNSNGLVAID